LSPYGGHAKDGGQASRTFFWRRANKGKMHVGIRGESLFGLESLNKETKTNPSWEGDIFF